jgi:hypothetical protein
VSAKTSNIRLYAIQGCAGIVHPPSQERNSMTIKQLKEALANVPDDATVEMEIWDETDLDNIELVGTDIGSIFYNSNTNTVSLMEDEG